MITWQAGRRIPIGISSAEGLEREREEEREREGEEEGFCRPSHCRRLRFDHHSRPALPSRASCRAPPPAARLNLLRLPAPPASPTSSSHTLGHLRQHAPAATNNFFSRISSWILSDSREDKIDDFVQEKEMNRFWKIDRRQAVAVVLLRNLDYKKVSHCSMKFQDEQKLFKHKAKCGFRPVNCSNNGCKVKFCAIHQERHDSICPYKVLPCEQKCPEMILRWEMDRHCVTVCLMRLMKCPF